MLTIALLAVLVPSAHARAAEDAPELSEDFAAISYSSLFRISGSHQLYAEAGACVLAPPIPLGGDSPCPEASPAETTVHVGARLLPSATGGALAVAPIPAWLTDRQRHVVDGCGSAAASVVNTAGVAYSLTGTPGGLTATGTVTGRHAAILRSSMEDEPSEPFCAPTASGLTDHSTSSVTMSAPFTLDTDALVALSATLSVASAPLEGDNTMDVTVSVAGLSRVLEGDAALLGGGPDAAWDGLGDAEVSTGNISDPPLQPVSPALSPTPTSGAVLHLPQHHLMRPRRA